jgi:predicted nucleic acid-binding protein
MSTEFVLDCSATLPWIFASEATTATDRLLDQLSEGAKAWVTNLWHRGRRGDRDARLVKDLWLRRKIWLTMYDAAYLELALRRGLPLATLDNQLRTAMKKAGGGLVL